MRDFIVIRQKAFYEYLQNYNKNKSEKEKIKLDLKDLAIFDYIAQFCLSDNEKIKSNRIMVDGKEYTYIAYKKIMEDNPLLEINTKNKLLKRLNKLFRVKLLHKYLKKDEGNKLYFTMSQEGYTLLTNGDIGYSPNGIQGIAQSGHSLYPNRDTNSNINIENNNREIKIENKDNLYIGSLSDFEKNFLGVISNLKDLGLKYGLRAYKEKEYLKAYRQLLKEGYDEYEIITSIYARMYKATMEEVDKFKFLQTIINPKYLVKSIDQLIDEKNILIDELMDTYEENIDVIDDELMPYKVIFITYYEDYKAVYKVIDDKGYFKDMIGYELHLKEVEYHIYLMNKFLSARNITINDNIRGFIISNSVKNIPYYDLIKTFLFGLIHLSEDEELLKEYSTIRGLSNLYNNFLNSLEINMDLDEVIEKLEKRLIIE